jgi:hypothetical protein
LKISQLLSNDPRAGHTYRLDFSAMFFTGAVLACIQILDVIGAKAYGAGSFEIALIRSGMGLGMMASYWVATRVVFSRRVPYVTWPQALSRFLLVSLVAVPWLPAGMVLPFFCLCAVGSSALEHVTLPARLTLYRHNYPLRPRPLVASRVRQAQMGMLLLIGGGLGLAMDWNSAHPEGLGQWMDSWVRGDLLPKDTLLKFGVPAIALISFVGVILFSRIREGARVRNKKTASGENTLPGIKEWASALAGNKSFLMFEVAYFLFGFGNLMTVPLMVILITKPEYGINASYFEAMLLQAVIWQLGIIVAAPFMGKLVQRFNPLLLRGVLTLSFAVDLCLMYMGFATQSILPLYIGKGIRGFTMAGGMLLWELGPMYFARDKEKAPTYIGIHTVLTGIRATISPWVGASLATAFSLGSAILTGVALQVVAAVVLLVYFFSAKHERLYIQDIPEETGGRPQGPIT